MDAELMKWAEAQEEAAGPRGVEPPPEGYYLVAVAAADSTIRSSKRGEPVMSPRIVIQDGPMKGRNLQSNFYWFVDENKDPDTFEKRTASTRRSTTRDLMGLFYQAAEQDADDVASSLMDSLEAFGSKTDPSSDQEEVREAMETFLAIADGLPFIARVTHDEWNDDVYANFRPYTFHRGKKTTTEDLFNSYTKGMEKLPADQSGDADDI